MDSKARQINMDSKTTTIVHSPLADKYVKPNVLTIAIENPEAEQLWRHYRYRFELFLRHSNTVDENDKIDLLRINVSAQLFERIVDYPSYDEAIYVLSKLFVKRSNNIFQCHKLCIDYSI
ncbi:hypothetical protein ACOME3_002915 [Neoechinorhynchus agilis]